MTSAQAQAQWTAAELARYGQLSKSGFASTQREQTAHAAQRIVAHTIKGKGISFMEDRVEWHHKVPSAEQVELALQELTK